jgi:hypothetical protein
LAFSKIKWHSSPIAIAGIRHASNARESGRYWFKKGGMHLFCAFSLMDGMSFRTISLVPKKNSQSRTLLNVNKDEGTERACSLSKAFHNIITERQSQFISISKCSECEWRKRGDLRQDVNSHSHLTSSILN